MATIKVNSAVMKDKAQSFQAISNSIKTFVETMTKEIDGMKSSWEGDAAETTIKEYHRLAEGFDEIYKTIAKYVNFLNNAADAYKKVEDANQTE